MNEQVKASLWQRLWRVGRGAVFAPVLWLYLKAPRLWGLGGYGGLYAEDACSRLTNSPAAFWQHHPELCQELLETKVEGAAIFLLGVLAGMATWQLCLLAWRASNREVNRRDHDYDYDHDHVVHDRHNQHTQAKTSASVKSH